MSSAEVVSQSVILPTIPSKQLVFRSDPWYRFLTGNRPEVTSETCGVWVWKGCLNHEKHGFPIIEGQVCLTGGLAKRQDIVKGVTLSCGKLACPVCYEKACAKVAHRSENRIKRFKWSEFIAASKVKNPNFVTRAYMKGVAKKYHWAISVPTNLYHLSREELIPIARKIAVFVGIDGGNMVFHHLRRYNSDDLDEDMKFGFSWKTAPASWYFSPHFHVVGVGFTSEEKIRALGVYQRGKKKGQKKPLGDCWVVRNLGERESVKSTVQYQLSHAYIPEGKKHAITWFGCMSYNKFKSCVMPPKEPEVCPECGSEFRKLKFVNSEAENIVISTVTGEGIYHFDHGFFAYADGDPPPWERKYRGRN